MIFIITAFLAIPISTAFAQVSLHGDPVIEYVSSELLIDEETTREMVSSSEIILYLDVELKAVKNKAIAVNATLSFEDRECLVDNQLLINKKCNPRIMVEQTTWNTIMFRESKEAEKAFAITGLTHLPEKITFKLEIEYINPHDGESYTTTETFTTLSLDTTIEITNWSNPPDRPKGDDIPISLSVKNTGSEYAYGICIETKLKSIKAGTLYDPYENSAGAIILHTAVYAITDIIAPGTTINFNYDIPCVGYSNGAMNLGTWELIELKAYTYNSLPDTLVSSDFSDPQFDVITKSKNNGPHAFFIYYLWNSGGEGDNWGGDNPRNYFENGYGSCKAGLHCFSDPDSNIPVLLNPVIAYDDDSWSIPSGYHNDGEIRDHGKDYVESQLNINYWWSFGNVVYRKNCGFDIILMLAGRRGNAAGTVSRNLPVIFKYRIFLPSDDRWKSNIDGVVMHEISHVFRCIDVVHGHPKIPCIMTYWQTWTGYLISYIYEYISFWGEGRQVDGWNTGCCCQTHFNDNWDNYYRVTS